MLCEKCANSEATFHLTEISNNIQSELHLCMKCAKNIQLNSRTEKSMSVKNAFPLLNNESVNEQNNLICLSCGLTGIELSWSGRPGCPSCYKYFNSIFNNMALRKSKDKYSGKKPLNYVEILHSHNPINNKNIYSLNTLEALEDKLRTAVLEERYEEAAEIRDKIKEVKTVE